MLYITTHINTSMYLYGSYLNNRALWICQPILIVWMIDTVDKAIHVLCTSTWGRSSAALLLWKGVWILYYLFYVFRDLIILLMETRDVPTLVENTRWEKKLWSQSYTCKIFANLTLKSSPKCAVIFKQPQQSMRKLCSYHRAIWLIISKFYLSWLILTCHIIEYRVKLDKGYLSLWQVNPNFLPVADMFCLTLTCDRWGFTWTASGHKKFTLLPWPVAIDEGRVENWNLCHSFLLLPYPMLFSCFTSTSW